MNCLRNAATAPPGEVTLAKLQALHPAAAPPTVPVSIPASTLLQTEVEVRKAIVSFGKGSSGGCSGLTADHLKELSCVAGTEFLPKLGHLCRRILAVKSRSPSVRMMMMMKDRNCSPFFPFSFSVFRFSIFSLSLSKKKIRVVLPLLWAHCCGVGAWITRAANPKGKRGSHSSVVSELSRLGQFKVEWHRNARSRFPLSGLRLAYDQRRNTSWWRVISISPFWRVAIR